MLNMMHFMHFHYVPHCRQLLHGPTCCGTPEGVAANQQGRIPRMHLWEYYFELLVAALRYEMRHLKETCKEVLIKGDDIFNGLDILSTHGSNGRTIMGQMLHDLYSWYNRCLTEMVICDINPLLDDILQSRMPKLLDLLKRTDDGTAQLRKDILDLYEASAAYEATTPYGTGMLLRRFREDHQWVLEEMKEKDEEVVQDQDGIWTLQIKPDALKVASKL